MSMLGFEKLSVSIGTHLPAYIPLAGLRGTVHRRYEEGVARRHQRQAVDGGQQAAGAPPQGCGVRPQLRGDAARLLVHHLSGYNRNHPYNKELKFIYYSQVRQESVEIE